MEEDMQQLVIPGINGNGNRNHDDVHNLTQVIQNVFGNDVWDDSAKRTAERVLAYWQENSAPLVVDAQGMAQLDFNFTAFKATANQLIVVKDIEFHSMCAHHLLPFYGMAHVGYVPNEYMVGLSKIPRLVDFYARRPCTQEAMAAHIAHDLKHRLAAMGVAVILEARHTCMACRGANKHNGAMITSEMRGTFLTAEALRSEFLNLIGRGQL
jgi:GTP cyclohydrolase I